MVIRGKLFLLRRNIVMVLNKILNYRPSQSLMMSGNKLLLSESGGRKKKKKEKALAWQRIFRLRPIHFGIYF